MFGKLGCTWS